MLDLQTIRDLLVLVAIVLSGFLGVVSLTYIWSVLFPNKREVLQNKLENQREDLSSTLFNSKGNVVPTGKLVNHRK
jgi:hypothetical protein